MLHFNRLLKLVSLFVVFLLSVKSGNYCLTNFKLNRFHPIKVIFFNYVDSLAYGQRIKLKEIEVLTLYKDKLTTGNRVSGVPQVKAIALTLFLVK